MEQRGRHIRLTSSDFVCREPCRLCVVLLTVATTGDSVTLYDGQDASGRVIATLKGEADITNPIQWGDGVVCTRGLYAEFSATDSEACFGIYTQRESEEQAS